MNAITEQQITDKMVEAYNAVDGSLIYCGDFRETVQGAVIRLGCSYIVEKIGPYYIAEEGNDRYALGFDQVCHGWSAIRLA